MQIDKIIRSKREKIHMLAEILSIIMQTNNISQDEYIITGSYGFGPYYPTNNLDVLIDVDNVKKIINNINLINLSKSKYKLDMTQIYNKYVDDNTNDFAIYFHTDPIYPKYSIENVISYAATDAVGNKYITGKLLMDFRNDINRPVMLVGNTFDNQLNYYYNKYKKYKQKYLLASN